MSDADQYRINPQLSGRNAIFDPTQDPPGKYRIERPASGSCPSSILVELEESHVQWIELQPVFSCGTEDIPVGLLPGEYQNVIWWDGVIGDSTIIPKNAVGPFTVEAEKNGCVYLGEISVTRTSDPSFPGNYPDQISICDGYDETIIVHDLDSLIWGNVTYSTGEEITIRDAGNFILKGYSGACLFEKSIEVNIIQGPGDQYNQTIEWCESENLTIHLPGDDSDRSFTWPDGEKEIHSAGIYPFSIREGDCEFEGQYEIISDPDCGEDCTLSFPNVIVQNGNEENNHFQIYGICDNTLSEISIYDRWGTQIYTGHNPKIDWEIWDRLDTGIYVIKIFYETKTMVQEVIFDSVLVLR